MLISKRPKILLAPLDWGLGHTTRCIPIIKELLSRNCEVLIGAEAQQKRLLEAEFPKLRYIDLPGYGIRYSRKTALNSLKIISQIPKILIQIKLENQWLNNILAGESLDAVISDNRYGLHAPGLYSVFITHQLCIKTPFGKKIERKLSKINYCWINRFSACWVPDFPDDPSLAGDLSHPERLPGTTTRYIGPLTRLVPPAATPKRNDLLVILSGPEPQRSFFENKVFSQLENYRGDAVVLRGLPGAATVPVIAPNIRVYNHLSSGDLSAVMQASEFVLGRSGYSSIMDIAAFGKKCILIPTPGQPEQEYLAEYLSGLKLICAVGQRDFVLESCLEDAKKFPFAPFRRPEPALLASAINEMLGAISQ